MALKQPFMVKHNFDAATASLSLTAKPGESLRVKGLRFGALAAGGFLQCFINRVSVGFWYIGDIAANHLEQWSIGTPHGNVFNRLMDLGLFAGYPVAEGETFEVKPAVAGASVIGAIEYEIGEKDDFKSSMPNGSAAKEFFYLNYGTNPDIIPINTGAALSKSRNPSEYPAFPFGEVVPAKSQVAIYGLLVMSWKTAQGVANPNYTYLKFVKDRITLFDEDRLGIYIREGMGFGSWGPCRQAGMPIELFPAPIVFNPGEELQIQLSIGGTQLAADGILLASIQQVKTLE